MRWASNSVPPGNVEQFLVIDPEATERLLPEERNAVSPWGTAGGLGASCARHLCRNVQGCGE